MVDPRSDVYAFGADGRCQQAGERKGGDTVHQVLGGF